MVVDQCKSYRPLKPEIILINGDAIDGPGHKNRGSEQIVTAEDRQVDMAVEVIEFMMKAIGCKNVVMTYGTGYHVGNVIDFEELIASRVGAIIKNDVVFEVGGVNFHARHHVGRTGVPGAYGLNAVGKEAVSYRLDQVVGDRPDAKVFIRSHNHYKRCDSTSSHTLVQLPALEWPNTKFGRRCPVGVYDMGMAVAHVDNNGEVTIQFNLLKGQKYDKEVINEKSFSRNGRSTKNVS